VTATRAVRDTADVTALAGPDVLPDARSRSISASGPMAHLAAALAETLWSLTARKTRSSPQ